MCFVSKSHSIAFSVTFQGCPFGSIISRARCWKSKFGKFAWNACCGSSVKLWMTVHDNSSAQFGKVFHIGIIYQHFFLVDFAMKHFFFVLSLYKYLFFVHSNWGNDPIRLIFFKWVTQPPTSRKYSTIYSCAKWFTGFLPIASQKSTISSMGSVQKMASA